MQDASDSDVTVANRARAGAESIADAKPASECRLDQPFLIFHERGMRYALPAGSVREALRMPRLTPLEETAPWVLGAFELRGELVPLLSPALCLRHPPVPRARLTDIAVVADCDGHPLAFRADEITTLARPRRVLPVPTDANDDGKVIAYEVALEDGIARPRPGPRAAARRQRRRGLRSAGAAPERL